MQRNHPGTTRTAPNPPRTPPPRRSASAHELAAGLVTLVGRLDESLPACPRAYADCQTLLSALRPHCAEHADSRALIALHREAAWHVRCLAGLDDVATGPSGRHHAWALDCLRDLARRLAPS